MRTEVGVWLVGLAVLAGLAAHGAAAAERLSGQPKIKDGDSFSLADSEVRLFGIDAPEGRQSCTRGDREWRCGDAAAAKLKSLVGSSRITCLRRDIDTYGRVVAECHRGNLDLAAEMVRAGLALAYRRYSTAYVDEENEARAARRGLWAGDFTPPEEWRRDSAAARPTRSAARAPRDGCRIKGNINASGEKIYHTPASASYAATVVDERQGERWFCSVADARRAGFRAPQQRGSR
jgi:endonuclease YncB( thermonuclease family)